MAGIQDFQILKHLYATRLADGSEADSISTKERVLLWKLRYRLSENVEERFSNRLETIVSLKENGSIAGDIPDFHSYGVDVGGIAFVAMDFFKSESIFNSLNAVSDRVNRFFQIVQLVASLHASKIVLGDICEDSFLLKGGNTVVLVALLGGFELEAKGTTVLPPPSSMNYLSPEQKMGSSAELSTDIYSLGILGYRLLTGRYPLAGKSTSAPEDDPLHTAPAPTVVSPDLPIWIDDLLGRCVEARSKDRFSDAVQLLQQFDECKRTNISPPGTTRWSRKTLMVRPAKAAAKEDKHQRPGAGTQIPLNEDREEKARPKRDKFEDEDNIPSRKPLNLFIVFSCFLVLGVLFAGAYVLLRGTTPNANIAFTKENEQFSFAPVEFQPLINDIINERVSFDQKKISLEKIAKSEEPLAYPVIVLLLRSAKEENLKILLLDTLLNRIREQGLVRVADILKKWIDTASSSGQKYTIITEAPFFLSALRSCDQSLPVDARRVHLHRSFSEDKLSSLALAAALSLDDPDPDRFTPVLRQLLTISGVSGELSNRSAPALVISYRPLLVLFEGDIRGMIQKMSPPDLAWSMIRLAESDNALLYDIIEETIARKIVPPYQSLFLEVLAKSDKTRTSKDIKLSLLKAARGEAGIDDVSKFGRWESASAEEVLLSVCALSKDPEVALKAFETLSGKSIISEPAYSLFEWIRTRLWEHRKELIKAVGILGLSRIADEREIDYALDILMPFSGSGSLFRAILKAGNPVLIAKTIPRVAVIIQSKDLLELLSNLDKNVRIAAVKALADRNDVHTLKYIVRGYEKETDQDVKDVYKQNHWVISQRENK